MTTLRLDALREIERNTQIVVDVWAGMVADAASCGLHDAYAVEVYVEKRSALAFARTRLELEFTGRFPESRGF